MKAQRARLMKEAKMLQSELPAGIVCIPREECLDRYHAQIDGPPSTPYERGRFSVDVSLSSCYPMEPPSMRFETRIYHPNIDDHGNICLDVLKSGKNGCWTPSWTLAKVLVALSVLLATPNPHDPLMPDIADQMLSDGSAYMAAAREWTARYAAPSAEDAAAEPDTSVGTAVPNSDAGDGESPTKRRKVTDKDKRPAPPVRPPGLSRKPSPGPDRPPPLPPTGIRRLGLSRSRNSVPKHLPRASPSAGSQDSSPPESIELTSDDGQPRASPGRQRALPLRARNAKLSQILGQPKARKAVPGRGSTASPASQDALLALDDEDEAAGEDEGSGNDPEPQDAGTPDDESTGLTNHDDDDDNDDEGYECLLDSDDSSSPDSTAAPASDELSSATNEALPLITDGPSSAVTDGPSTAVGEPSPAVDEPSAAVDESSPTVDEPLPASDEPSPVDKILTLPVNDPPPAVSGSVVPIVAAGASSMPTTGSRQSAPAKRQECRGKGKGVDYTTPVAHSTVLLESHFGPLDLGLPPVRVSSQRRLLRRTRDAD